MKKILALILAMVMCFSLLAACGSKDDAQNTGSGNSGTGTTNTGSGNAGTGTGNTAAGVVTTPDATVKYKDTVKISQVGEITSGGYYSATAAAESYYARMTHQPLFRFNYETNSPDPILVEKAEDVNGDGKTWKYTLKKGVMFHYREEDYGEMKASDVKFTYEFVAPNGPGVTNGTVLRTSTTMNYVDSIEVVGDYELIFHLNTVLFDMPSYTTEYILSEKAIKDLGELEGQHVGTGPYYINYDESKDAQYWTMTRYDDYWGGIENHPTKNVVFVVNADLNTGAAALQAGEVDVLVSAGATIALQFANNPDYKILTAPTTNIPFIGFNTYDGTGFFDGEDEPDQIKLRQAINYAIDRDAMCSILYATLPEAGRRVDSIFYTATEGFVDLGQFEFSVEKGQALMKELGYSETKRLPLKLAHYGSYTTFAQIVQDQLKAIYIDVELVTMDTSIFGTTLRTGMGWDLVVNYYGTDTSLGGTLGKALKSTGSNAKTYGWNSAVMDEKVDYVMNQTSFEAQKEAFAEFQKWVRDYVPRIPCYSGNLMHCMTADVEGVTVCPASGNQDWSTIRIPE